MSVRCPDGHESESTDYCDICGLPIAAATGAGGGSGSGPGSGGAPSGLDLATPPPLPAPTIPAPVSGYPGAPSSGSAGAEKTCPNCGSEVPDADLFCEVCGYDFTTGALPAPVTAPGGIAVQGGSEAQIGGAAVVTPAPDAAGVGGYSSSAGAQSGSGAGVGSGFASTDGGAGGGGGPAQSVLTWVAEVWVDPDWYATQESDEPCPSAGMPVVRPLWDTSVLIGRRSASRNIHPQIDCGVDHGVSRRHAQLTTDGQRWWAEDLQSSNGTFVGHAGAPIPTVPITPGQRIEFAPGDRLYVGAWTRIVIRKATPDEQ